VEEEVQPEDGEGQTQEQASGGGEMLGEGVHDELLSPHSVRFSPDN
jgi:hypothetical protein